MGGGVFQGDGDDDDDHDNDDDDDDEEEIDFPKQFRGRLTVFIDPHSGSPLTNNQHFSKLVDFY